MFRLSPRSAKSNWSSINKKRAARLIKAGRMHPSGMAAIELAKKIGTWDFLDEVGRLVVPDDLASEFRKRPGSKQLFDRFPPSSRKGILEWIKNSKTTQTRLKRIVETARKAAKNRKANHPRNRDYGSAS